MPSTNLLYSPLGSTPGQPEGGARLGGASTMLELSAYSNRSTRQSLFASAAINSARSDLHVEAREISDEALRYAKMLSCTASGKCGSSSI